MHVCYQCKKNPRKHTQKLLTLGPLLLQVVHHEFEEKLGFIQNNPLLKLWANKWKKTLAVALDREVRSYEEPLVRQGDKAENIYFIIRQVSDLP